MPTLQLISTRPGAGKSAIAAGIAMGLARAGSTVRLVRAGSSEAAHADAAGFADLLFASSSGTPVPVSALDLSATPNEVVILELDAGAEPIAGTPAIVVTPATVTDADRALVGKLKDRLVGSIATRVGEARTESVARDLTNAGLRPLAILPEERVLAAPSVDEIRDELGAELLYDGENGAEVVEDVLIAPVYADPARPHFRRFPHKAILAPYNKTDLLIASIESNAACLVITGGSAPSPYVFDRAQHGETTVMLSAHETPGTVAALGDVWFRSRFRGERKASAAHALLASRLDLSGLLRKLG